MNHPASNALQLCRGFLEETLRRREIDLEALNENYWRIDGVKRLLQSLTSDDDPLTPHLEAAQRVLIAKRDFDDRQAALSALNALPVRWESPQQDDRNPNVAKTPSDTWLRYRAWLSTRPRR